MSAGAEHELLPNLFRLEYSKMTAVLYRRFGLKHIEIAEDIVSDTFTTASANWTVNGTPENPVAWLYAVAKNKARDCLKHLSVIENHQKETNPDDHGDEINNFEFTHQHIADSQLAMIFAVCNPGISPEAQICLALQVLCGFSVEAIANAFLSKTETIKKRLQRARADLRRDNFQISVLTKSEIVLRMDAVLKTLYLLFNEGYFSKTSDKQVQKELCLEAIRLTLLLTENAFTNTPQANALLALFCFQGSRLDARTNDKGETIVYEQQDKKLWDKALTEKGNYYLVEACNGNETSKYHLEAAIAYWHTTPAGTNKWQHILQLYDQLILIERSPIAVLNRIFALAKVKGHTAAIAETEKLNLVENSYYHELLGYLYTATNPAQAIAYYDKAIRLTKSLAEKKTLQKEIQQLRLRHPE